LENVVGRLDARLEPGKRILLASAPIEKDDPADQGPGPVDLQEKVGVFAFFLGVSLKLAAPAPPPGKGLSSTAYFWVRMPRPASKARISVSYFSLGMRWRQSWVVFREIGQEEPVLEDVDVFSGRRIPSAFGPASERYNRHSETGV